jgi:hypothetical protein
LSQHGNKFPGAFHGAEIGMMDATYNGLRLKTVMPAFDAVSGANERQMTGRLRLRYRR